MNNLEEINVFADIFSGTVQQVGCSCTIDITSMGTVIAEYYIEVSHP